MHSLKCFPWFQQSPWGLLVPCRKCSLWRVNSINAENASAKAKDTFKFCSVHALYMLLHISTGLING
ncbi:hypothetical protein XENTR_v10018727 [Xenopus tropicalis]|nr:hypothetical protein XENTR_v10018727 [Xenopus tropicalis]